MHFWKEKYQVAKIKLYQKKVFKNDWEIFCHYFCFYDFGNDILWISIFYEMYIPIRLFSIFGCSTNGFWTGATSSIVSFPGCWESLLPISQTVDAPAME